MKKSQTKWSTGTPALKLFLMEIVLILLDATNFGIEENGFIEKTFFIYICIKTFLLTLFIVFFLYPSISLKGIEPAYITGVRVPGIELTIPERRRVRANFIVNIGYNLSVIYLIGIV